MKLTSFDSFRLTSSESGDGKNISAFESKNRVHFEILCSRKFSQNRLVPVLYANVCAKLGKNDEIYENFLLQKLPKDGSGRV